MAAIRSPPPLPRRPRPGTSPPFFSRQGLSERPRPHQAEGPPPAAATQSATASATDHGHPIAQTPRRARLAASVRCSHGPIPGDGRGARSRTQQRPRAMLGRSSAVEAIRTSQSTVQRRPHRSRMALQAQCVDPTPGVRRLGQELTSPGSAAGEEPSRRPTPRLAHRRSGHASPRPDPPRPSRPTNFLTHQKRRHRARPSRRGQELCGGCATAARGHSRQKRHAPIGHLALKVGETIAATPGSVSTATRCSSSSVNADHPPGARRPVVVCRSDNRYTPRPRQRRQLVEYDVAQGHTRRLCTSGWPKPHTPDQDWEL